MGSDGVGRYLPHALAATALITLAPALLVWLLRELGLVTSTVSLVAFGMLFSLLLAWGGRNYWQRRSGSQDLLFGELMIWGWFGRWRSERRIGDAVSLLGLKRSLELEPEPEQRIQTLRKLAAALETRDPYTHGHSKRVARYAAMVAKGMGLPAQQVDKVRAAAAVHDVGKLDTPLEVLNKPDRLSEEEFAVVKEHAARGSELVAELGDPELTLMVRHHHERLDGGGYPDGLAGEEIPLGARIISVADTFDAITSNRAYRRSNPHRRAIDILRKEAGTQLDADAVDAFCRRYTGLRPVALYSAATTTIPRIVQPLFSQVSAATATAASTAAGVVAAGVVAGTLAVAPSDAEDRQGPEAVSGGSATAPATRSGSNRGGSAKDNSGGGGSRKGGGKGGAGGNGGGDGSSAPAATPTTPSSESTGTGTGTGIETPSQPGPGGLGGGSVPDPPDVGTETPDPPSTPTPPGGVPGTPDLPQVPDPGDLPLPGLP